MVVTHKDDLGDLIINSFVKLRAESKNLHTTYTHLMFKDLTKEVEKLSLVLSSRGLLTKSRDIEVLMFEDIVELNIEVKFRVEKKLNKVDNIGFVCYN